MKKLSQIIMLQLSLFGLASAMFGAEKMMAIVEKKGMNKAPAVSPKSAQPQRKKIENSKLTGEKDGAGEGSTGLTHILQGPAAHLWQKGVKKEDMNGVFGVGKLNLPTILLFDDDGILNNSERSPLILFPIGASKVVEPQLYNGPTDMFDPKPVEQAKEQPTDDSPQSNVQPVPKPELIQDNSSVKEKTTAGQVLEDPAVDEQPTDNIDTGASDLITDKLPEVVVEKQIPEVIQDMGPQTQAQPTPIDEQTKPNVQITEQDKPRQEPVVAPVKRIRKVYLIEVVSCRKCQNDSIVAAFLKQTIGI